MEHEYYCPSCGKSKTITHGMMSRFELPAALKKQITCTTKKCPNKGQLYEKVYQVALGGFVGGRSVTEHELVKMKQKERKLRSKRHFKYEVLPKLRETKRVKQFFNERLKHITPK